LLGSPLRLRMALLKAFWAAVLLNLFFCVTLLRKWSNDCTVILKVYRLYHDFAPNLNMIGTRCVKRSEYIMMNAFYIEQRGF